VLSSLELQASLGLLELPLGPGVLMRLRVVVALRLGLAPNRPQKRENPIRGAFL
jgi:hypothetical protein